MPFFLLKFVLDAACGALNALGGFCFLPARRFIMPSVIAVTAVLASHVWWTIFLPLPAMGTLCLGYHNEGNAGRGLWVFIQAVALSAGLAVTGHLWAWYLIFPYVVVAGMLGGIYRNWPQLIGDAVTGCWFGAIVFIIR